MVATTSTLGPIADYYVRPGDLTPDAIMARVSPDEAQLLGLMPQTLSMITVLYNEVAAIATRLNPTPRATRRQQRERVIAARVQHPEWTWQRIADEVGLSKRWVMQLYADARRDGVTSAVS